MFTRKYGGVNKSMKNKIIRLAAVIAVVGLAFVWSAPAAKAQSNGLGITPKITLLSKPGGQISDNLRLNNLSNTQPLNVRIALVDFRPANETGTPQLLQDPNAPLTPWSLKPYISIPDTINVPAGQSKNIPFTVKFPANVGAGSYYVAVEYKATGANDQQKVTISASSATLLFPPSEFTYRLKNSGNLNESPAGSIVVKNMLGHIIANIDSVNPRSELALIGQTRRFQVCYPKSKAETDLPKADNCGPLPITPGRYTAQIVLLYGQNGQPSRQITANATFWYLPLWFDIVAILVLAAIVWIIYWLYNRIKSPRRGRR
jgi:hypothetical protein